MNLVAVENWWYISGSDSLKLQAALVTRLSRLQSQRDFTSLTSLTVISNLSAVLEVTSPLITPPLFFGMSKKFCKVSKGKSKTDNFPPYFSGKSGRRRGGEVKSNTADS